MVAGSQLLTGLDRSPLRGALRLKKSPTPLGTRIPHLDALGLEVLVEARVPHQPRGGDLARRRLERDVPALPGDPHPLDLAGLRRTGV